MGRELLLNLHLSPYFNTVLLLDNLNFNFINNIGLHYDIFLPVGVSFFTFQSLSYTIDVYKGNIKPLKSIVDYGFFVSFFPQLVAGPIVRASDFLPQINKKPFLNNDDLGKALFLIMAGLIKKAVISDYISGNFVDRVFDNPMLYSGFENLMASYGYALQIYCDFSGYSDMAIGIALLLGFHLPVNFNSPYISGSITEFWRRWHISLSSWLRDYLYIPLGGNRKGNVRTNINLMLTMVLGGLWHGASLKFIIWGALHGAVLGLEKLLRSLIEIFPNWIINWFRWIPKWLIKVVSIVLTFHFVCYCWIYFRAKNYDVAKQVINQSWNFVKQVWEFIVYRFAHISFNLIDWIRSINYHIYMSPPGKIIVAYMDVFILILIGFIIHFIPKKIKMACREVLVISHPIVKSVVLALVIYLVIQIKSADIKPFIYFQF